MDHFVRKIIFALHLSLAFLRYNPASLCLYRHICTAFDEDKERSTTHAHRFDQKYSEEKTKRTTDSRQQKMDSLGIITILTLFVRINHGLEDSGDHLAPEGEGHTFWCSTRDQE